MFIIALHLVHVIQHLAHVLLTETLLVLVMDRPQHALLMEILHVVVMYKILLKPAHVTQLVQIVHVILKMYVLVTLKTLVLVIQKILVHVIHRMYVPVMDKINQLLKNEYINKT